MGRVTDGSCKLYTKENPFIPAQKPYEVDTTAQLITSAMNLGSCILGSILNGSRNADSSTDAGSNAADTEAAAAQKKAEIDTILKKYDVDTTDAVDPNYSDVALALEKKTAELNEHEAAHQAELDKYKEAKAILDTANNEKAKYDREIAKKNADLNATDAKITNLKKEWKNNDSQIKNLTSQKETLENSENANTDAVKSKIKSLKAEIKKLTDRQDKINKELGSEDGKGLYGEKQKIQKEIDELNQKITDLDIEKKQKAVNDLSNDVTKAYDDYCSDIDEIKGDLQTLDNYYGKTSIDKQTNKETEAIVTLLKKYNKETDPAKKEKLKKEIAGQITVYDTAVANGAPKNPTVEKFKEFFNGNEEEKREINARAARMSQTDTHKQFDNLLGIDSDNSMNDILNIGNLKYMNNGFGI